MQRKSSLSQFKLAKNVANNCFSTVHSVLSEIPLELVKRLMSVDGSTISKQPARQVREATARSDIWQLRQSEGATCRWDALLNFYESCKMQQPIAISDSARKLKLCSKKIEGRFKKKIVDFFLYA